VNEFRSSGDGTRLESNPNRVDTSIENVPNYPQYINFSWETLITANETWDDDFSSMNYDFDPVTTTQIRLVILGANKGPKIEYNGGIEGNGSRIVRIAGGYYSIAEVELNERK
jgi:hypothetical protein